MKLPPWMIAADRTPLRLRNFQALPRIIRDTIIIIVGAHILCEVPSFLCEAYPDIVKVNVKCFLSPNFKEPIQLVWYLKFLFIEISDLCFFYCFAKIAAQYSNTLFVVIAIFFGYHVVDFIMFVWDFKTSHYLFFDLLWTAALLVKRAVKPFKPETIAKIKSLF